MPKNICIFSDGTGQGGSARRQDNTNVWKLFRVCEGFEPRQVCSYDAGLGAPDANWTRWAYNLVSQTTGLGISRNIKDCYNFLLEIYEDGDQIYLFGFSRGAYTVRSLGGVLKLCGVPRGVAGKDRAASERRKVLVEEAVQDVYKTYGDDEAKKAERRERGAAFRAKTDAAEAVPHFIGVWDTVRALGGPGSSGLVWWRRAFHDATLDDRVPYARQALSIDENRETFAPEISEVTKADVAVGRIKQCRFLGVHADVGGGYGDDPRLSELALDCMVSEATSLPDGISLLVDPAKLPTVGPDHAFALQHDERFPQSFFREGTREKWYADPWLACATLADPSVKARIGAAGVPTLRGTTAYRPWALSRYDPTLWPKT